MAIRLNKVLAASGLASRRGADALIERGSVTVNGAVVTSMGTQVEESDVIAVNGKLLKKTERVTYALYKPRGVVCSRVQQRNEEIVTGLVPENPPVYPIGRLDRDSEGLILLSNNGDLTAQLTHPKFEHQKEYEVHGEFDPQGDPELVKNRLLKGVRLGDGEAKADSLSIKSFDRGILVFVITVHEGRHHLIRRMCASVDISVKRLIRIRISHLTLGTLKPGEWRKLGPSDYKLLA
ncbi:MAG TPA: pseudouridine synthase [Verrucomicrobiae bacterium]|nr:pseudouridine synthase [Verrucomicrobiae bacterium]